MTSRPSYLLIELESGEDQHGLVLAPLIPGMTAAESVELYRMQADQRRTTILDHMIANQIRAGALDDRQWTFGTWRLITDDERQEHYPDLTVPPAPIDLAASKPAPRKRYRLKLN